MRGVGGTLRVARNTPPRAEQSRRRTTTDMPRSRFRYIYGEDLPYAFARGSVLPLQMVYAQKLSPTSTLEDGETAADFALVTRCSCTHVALMWLTGTAGEAVLPGETEVLVSRVGVVLLIPFDQSSIGTRSGYPRLGNDVGFSPSAALRERSVHRMRAVLHAERRAACERDVCRTSLATLQEIYGPDERRGTSATVPGVQRLRKTEAIIAAHAEVRARHDTDVQNPRRHSLPSFYVHRADGADWIQPWGVLLTPPNTPQALRETVYDITDEVPLLGGRYPRLGPQTWNNVFPSKTFLARLRMRYDEEIQRESVERLRAQIPCDAAVRERAVHGKRRRTYVRLCARKHRRGEAAFADSSPPRARFVSPFH